MALLDCESRRPEHSVCRHLAGLPLMNCVFLFSSYTRISKITLSQIKSVASYVRGRESAVRLPTGQEIVHFAKLSRSALEPTQPSVQGVQASLTSGIKGLEREVGIHLHLAPRLRMSGAITSILPYACTACIGTNITFHYT